MCGALGSCPFDYVRIYDGPSNASEPIGSYCGRWSDVTVYSTTESMYVEFVTKSGRHEPFVRPPHGHMAAVTASVQRRGFRASFDITDRFVDLGNARRNVRRASLADLGLLEGVTLGTRASKASEH